VFTFDEGVTCQSAACNVYADVVFVVDNSKSVNSDEWKQTMRFVLNVLDEFDYGDSGVEAAVIQFSGTGITGEFEAGYKLKTAVSPCRPNNPGVESYEKAHQACGRFTSDPEQYDENHYPFPFNGRDDSASFISPSGAQTLSGSKESIIQPLVKSYQPEAYYRTPDNSNMWSSFGSTCQSFGLELAMRAFDNSERKNLEGLNRIVIVVTDGQDKCPNRTRKATDLLKKRRDQGGYGAYVFEIGVSLVSGCCNEYDSAFLMEIASDIGGEPAYYAVDDYDGMTTATSRLTRPICEQFDSTGCPDCTGGFCGCGQCFCPTCEPHQSTCKKYMCVPPEGGQSSLGCQEHNVTCEKTDDGEEADEICTFFQCNGDLEDGHGRCTLVKNDCAELKETFPDDDSQCYKVKCDPLYDGGCYPDPDHDWCQKKHAPKGANDKCEKWVCNKDADGALDDFCYKSFDKAEDEQEKLGKRGKCITITCDHDSGDTKENVNCGSPEIPCNEMECLEVEAVANGGDSKDYSCVETGTPEADQCGDYVCRKQGGKYKWVRDQTTVPDCVGLAVQAWKEEHQGEWTTEAEALDHGTRCRIIGCEGSCYNREEENCNPECTADDVNGCKAEGFGEGGTTENCVAKTCNAEQNGQGLWETSCIYVNNPHAVNCYTKLGGQKAREKNKDWKKTGICYTPTCEPGGCGWLAQARPESYVDNACKVAKCVSDEAGNVWSWVYVNTAEGDKCESCSKGNCFDSCECLPDSGCKRVDICTKDNDCVKATCEEDNGSLVCKSVNKELKETKCMKEECTPEGKKKWVQKDSIEDLCPDAKTNKCLTKPSCLYVSDTESKCQYQDKKCPSDECYSPCYNYACNPATGEFEKTKVCNDGLGCTIDNCDARGVCNYRVQINCYNEIDMTAYPCFVAVCEEDEKSEKGYRCKRKLQSNAYIDICGNCISTDPEGSASGSSEGQAVAMDCADAPAKPLLQEGLAAASIALIILGAVLIGAGIAASGIAGTKTLMNRAKGANNQSAHTNPLFEDNDAEMTNPAYVGTE